MPFTKTDPLVSASWLKDNLGAPDLRVIEATWYPAFDQPAGTARETYTQAHIPGAVFFDIDAIGDTSTNLPHMLPDTVFFASRARKLGIGDGNRLIVYDRNNFMASARVWWTLRTMGITDVRVLDGGWNAWLAAGGEVEDMPPVPMERHITPRFRADLVKSREQVLAAVSAGSADIIDARPAGRFTGESPEPRPGLPSGHIPGSRNVPASSLLNPDGTMKSPDELANLFGDLSRPIITTCGSGVTASTLALALARLGHDTVAVYDGSWAEWASSADSPIETGGGH